MNISKTVRDARDELVEVQLHEDVVHALVQYTTIVGIVDIARESVAELNIELEETRDMIMNGADWNDTPDGIWGFKEKRDNLMKFIAENEGF